MLLDLGRFAFTEFVAASFIYHVQSMNEPPRCENFTSEYRTMRRPTHIQ